MGGSCISSNYDKKQIEDKRGGGIAMSQINSFHKGKSSSDLNENKRKNNGHNTKNKAVSSNNYGNKKNIGNYNSGNTKSYKKEKKKAKAKIYIKN